MNVAHEYERLSRQVSKEHEEVFARQDPEELEQFMQALSGSSRIFVHGAGREGIALRSFAMRLMHLGHEVHWVFDDTTPGMHEGDLLLVSSGSGRIGHVDYLVDRAREAGSTVCVVTGTPNEMTPSKADHVLFVPAAVYLGTDDRCVPSVQPMGSLYEQHLMMLFDIMIQIMEQTEGTTHAQMEARHRNVE